MPDEGRVPAGYLSPAQEPVGGRRGPRVPRRLQELLDANFKPMLAVDPETLALLAANRSARSLYGLPTRNLRRITLADLTDTKEIRRLGRWLAAPRERGLASAGHWRHVTRQGQPLAAELWTQEIRSRVWLVVVEPEKPDEA